jgi:hypothetical protein
MDCPECGSVLATYTLSGREASVCERCGFVGIEADHAGDGDLLAVESWDDALRRYHEEVPALGSDAGARVPLAVRSAPEPADDESWAEALARFAGGEGDGGEAVPDADAGTDDDGRAAAANGTVGADPGGADPGSDDGATPGADDAADAADAGREDADAEPEADADADEADDPDGTAEGSEGASGATPDGGGE